MTDQPRTYRPSITDDEFARLCEVARERGRDAAYQWFGEGRTDSQGRPSRRRTLDKYLTDYPDKAAAFQDACLSRKDTLLARLRNEIEEVAFGPGDITTDFGKNGQVTRQRTDRRNKLYAVLRLLQAEDPGTWAERRKVDTTVNGQVDHRHSLGTSPMAYTLSADEIMQLEPDRAELLFGLLAELESIRQEKHHARREVIDVQQSEPARGLPAPAREDGIGDAG